VSNDLQAPQKLQLFPDTERLSSEELKRAMESGQPHVLLDVRDSHEYAISKLPNSINIPLVSLRQNTRRMLRILQTAVEDILPSYSSPSPAATPAIFVVCRRGNDSQRAVQLLRSDGYVTAVDVIGGLESWKYTVDSNLPLY
jgi:adenylyltransferase/sulfurtransferase